MNIRIRAKLDNVFPSSRNHGIDVNATLTLEDSIMIKVYNSWVRVVRGGGGGAPDRQYVQTYYTQL